MVDQGSRDSEPGALGDMAKDILAGPEKSPLYDIVYALAREELRKSRMILNEVQAFELSSRGRIPDSFWSGVRDGYRMAMLKYYNGTEICVWVLVRREYIKTKMLDVEVASIEKAVSDALDIKVESLADEHGGPVVNLRGTLN